jgi:hypothetical protein
VGAAEVEVGTRGDLAATLNREIKARSQERRER